MEDRGPIWLKTTSEIYEAIYETLRSSLEAGSVISIRIGNEIRLLLKVSQVRQGASPTEIYLRIETGWELMSRETIDDLANSFGLSGPTYHFDAVAEAINEDRQVPDSVVNDHAAWAGLDVAGKKAARQKQPTRTVNSKGIPLVATELDRPIRDDVIEYKLPNYLRSLMHVKDILAYRPFEKLWIVSVKENDDRFVIQRIVYMDDGADTQHWSVFGRH